MSGAEPTERRHARRPDRDARATPPSPAPRGGGTVAQAAFPFLAAAGFGVGATVLVLFLFTYFAGPIEADLHLSHTAVQGALSIYLAVLVVALPVWGVVADRLGARVTATISAALFAAGLAAISQASSRTTLYAAFAVTAALGAGAGPGTYTRAVVSRFHRRRGLALGITLAGGGVAQAVLPAIVRPFVDQHGWRAGFLLLAAVAAVVGTLAGSQAHERSHDAECPAVRTGVGLRTAAATPVFWIMGLAFVLLGAATAGATSHLVAIWRAIGRPASEVPAFQLVMGLSVIGGRLAGGALMDVVPARLVGAGAALLGTAGLALLAAGNVVGAGAVAAAVGIGACNGSETDVVSFLTGRLFGVRRFARIYGALAALFLGGGALGPLLAEWAIARAGIGPALTGGAALLALSSVALALTPRSAGGGRRAAAGGKPDQEPGE